MEEKKEKKIWFYDIEQISNFHSNIFKEKETGELRTFVIHESRNDILSYIDFLLDEVLGLIGFNCVKYDYQLLHFILTDLRHYEDRYNDPDFINYKLYSKSQDIINDRFSSIKPWEVIIPQLDLYMIHHFDNKAKRTSLKYCQCNLRYENVEDMPINHYDKVTEDDIPSILSYNLNDVNSTELLYKHTEYDIEVRRKLNDLYKNENKGRGINFTNFNDVKIGSEIFAREVSKRLNIDYYDLKELRTRRDQIILDQCISEKVKFSTPEFNNILDKFKSTIISGTKGNINIKMRYRGAKYDYGTGGIHAASSAGIYEPKEDEFLIDIDVASYYPRMIISQDIYPEHLGSEFNIEYENKYNYRMSLKNKEEKTDMDKLLIAIWKLALNGTYGKFSDAYSCFYDPLCTIKTTINGQLFISMLIEKVMTVLKGSIMVQANTDGVTFIIKKENEDVLFNICRRWENYTNLELEYSYYKKMIMRDVNNYIAIYDKPEEDLKPQFPEADWYDNFYTKHKTKGAFQVVLEQNGKIGLNKNWSKRIVPKALYNYFIYGISVRETIMNCTDILDFCIFSKGTKDWNAIYVNSQGIEKQLTKTNRYYCSIDGGKLIKNYTSGKSSGKREQIEAKARITLLNKYEEDRNFNSYNIDYSYYIKECNKEIQTIMGNGQTKLFE